MKRALHSILAVPGVLLDHILPHRCARCEAASVGNAGLCGSCFGAMVFTGQPACPGCARPTQPTTAGLAVRLCGVCIRDGTPFDHAVAALVYNAPAADILLKFKHGDRLDLAPLIARWMATSWRESNPPTIDYIVPVPLHWRRQMARRYNQSLELSRHLTGTLEGALRPELVTRATNTAQMRKMNRSQRRKNVAGAFKVSSQIPDDGPKSLRGKHVLVIDDVLTTGATLRAVAGTLRRAHVSRVSVLVASRVVRTDE